MGAGLGVQHTKKKFMVGGEGQGTDVKLYHGVDEEASDRIKEEAQAAETSYAEHKASTIRSEKRKRIIPYGDRILVSRRRIGEKIGSGLLYAADDTKDRATDVADVVYVPDHTFCDQQLIEQSEEIVKGLTQKAKDGDSAAVISLLRFNEYLKLKTLKHGDALLIGKYVGTDFNIKETGQSLTVIDGDGIYALITEAK